MSLVASRCLILAALLFVSAAPSLPAQNAPPLPGNQRFIPPPETASPTPPRLRPREEKPIRREWWIGGGISAALLVLFLVYRAVRAWRSSNLFDRAYRLTRPEGAALRLGAGRSGGHMAVLKYD